MYLWNQLIINYIKFCVVQLYLYDYKFKENWIEVEEIIQIWWNKKIYNTLFWKRIEFFILLIYHYRYLFVFHVQNLNSFNGDVVKIVEKMEF